MQRRKVADAAHTFQWYHCLDFGTYSHRTNKPLETAVPPSLPAAPLTAVHSGLLLVSIGGTNTPQPGLRAALETIPRPLCSAVQCSAVQCSAVQCSAL
jgi:hypothetical protein